MVARRDVSALLRLGWILFERASGPFDFCCKGGGSQRIVGIAFEKLAQVLSSLGCIALCDGQQAEDVSSVALAAAG